MAIEVRGLRRIYQVKPPVVALDGVDLEVAPGELFGVLGPNGAGKTTLIKPAPTSLEIIVALLVTGALGTLASIGVFRVSDRRAREFGLLDQTTGS